MVEKVLGKNAPNGGAGSRRNTVKKAAADKHILHHFSAHLSHVREHMLDMGAIVVRQLRDAITALMEEDAARAKTVQRREKKVNKLELSIDQECVSILARHQPAAGDLRLIIAVSKSIIDLERIGDEARRIANQALQLEGLERPGAFPEGRVEAQHIGNCVCNMLSAALRAFAELNADAAREVLRTDSRVDVEYRTAIRSLVALMIEEPNNIARGLRMMWALRSLERCGDHAKNIAEYVVYLVQGKDIRHTDAQEENAAPHQ